ncbi:MAG: hypothetical protein N2Z21_10055 [Candidatus Sumerlaeaceae bacterium]|nr:hypothetical protein [Candidatus Sumerlaeaceae bacterium]
MRVLLRPQPAILMAICLKLSTAVAPSQTLQSLVPRRTEATTVTADVLRTAWELWRSIVGRPAVRFAAHCDDFKEDLTTSPKVYNELAESLKQQPSSGAALVGPFEKAACPILPWCDRPMQQPRGSLSGKIVYCSAGHGWTCDNTSTTLWYTQRPLSFGIVEDYGNLDQLNLFADVLWRMGATIVPFRPLGAQPIERVLDNSNRQNVKFQGAWYDSTSPIYFGTITDEVPYKFALAHTTETAVARYCPYLPEDDFYPVYCWARDGADRVPQLYRIHHAGGYTEVRVDHRAVGKGWVYLGEFYFRRGWNGYVEISNRVDDPTLADGQHVVIADAIRFGNGRGDINRGGGISGYSREEEASRYWVERMLPIGAPPIFEPNETTDQNNNVGAPPRMAAFMNRERYGTFFDRIYLGFHTNAVGGRGAVGLFNTDPDKRTDRQVEFAQIVAQQLNDDMATSSGRGWPVDWFIRKKLTDSHINFGEIRRDAINNEMCATILEVAFHDNHLDAVLIRDPRFRVLVADSATKAILRFFKSCGVALPADGLPPNAPVLLSATALTSSSVCLKWSADDEHGDTSCPLRGFRIYYSSDGFAFGGGVDVGITTAVLVTDLPHAVPHFFRVAAYNDCGESRPSAVLGAFAVGATTAPRCLVVNAFSTFSEEIVLSRTVSAGLGAPLREGGEFVRIIPRKMNAFNYVAHWGTAIASADAEFDSCDIKELSMLRDIPTSYAAVMIALGKQSAEETPFHPVLMDTLEKFRKSGGAVVLSGTNVVKCMERVATLGEKTSKGIKPPKAAWQKIKATTETLHPKLVVGLPTDMFRGKVFHLDDGEGDAFVATGCDALSLAGATPVLYYNGDKNSCAMLTVPRSGGYGPVAIAGFPLECVQPAGDRAALFRYLLEVIGKSSPVTKGAQRHRSR